MESGGHVPANLSRVLRTVDFPATREILIAKAKEYGADHGVLEVLERMPPLSYGSMADVMQRYREVH